MLTHLWQTDFSPPKHFYIPRVELLWKTDYHLELLNCYKFLHSKLRWFRLVGLWCVTPLSTIFQLYRGVLLVDETGVTGDNHRPVASHSKTVSHNVVKSTPRHERDSNSQR